ncbi:WW domain-binding protein 4 isoform X6 [Piliocolobus tephrosceles]|uniref:WW domain-binding protein 4 isoform X6 n=1 Tax=Piliocolobus tephrosceles TaxID=591936 RepID=UPI000C2A7EC5|nr:WW domain-binding protein 4 isoform X6 [Piliocolobus tephrosceles]
MLVFYKLTQTGGQERNQNTRFKKADYWKSQPKKFCDYCKCWIADNRPSVEFHERGKNHKENVAKRISEIKQKSLDKAKEEEKASKEFAAMEAAALKAYQEDLKRLGLESEILEPSVTPVTSTIPPTSTLNQQKEKKEKKKKKKDPSKGRWVEGITSEGYHYYYDLISGASQWEKPEGFQGNLQKEKNKNDDGGNDPETQKEKSIQKQNSLGSNEEKSKTFKKSNPYGEWQEIKQEAESHEEVDLELPSTENEYVSTSEADGGGVPKVVFKEKTVTCLGVVAEGVAPVFKKRRTENGKSRNLRQRDTKRSTFSTESCRGDLPAKRPYPLC